MPRSPSLLGSGMGEGKHVGVAGLRSETLFEDSAVSTSGQIHCVAAVGGKARADRIQGATVYVAMILDASIDYSPPGQGGVSGA